MSSTYIDTVFSPQYMNGNRPDRAHSQRTVAAPESVPAGLSHLSPLSAQYPSSSASPTFQGTGSSVNSTPASLQYQTSDFSSSDIGDEFYGVDFGNLESGTPSFLEDGTGTSGAQSLSGISDPLAVPYQTPEHAHSNADGSNQSYLLSPEQTPSLRNTSPNQIEQRVPSTALPSTRLFEVPPARELVKTEQSSPRSHCTPDTSDDGLTSGAPVMPAQSPRVMVSMYSKDGHVPIDSIMPSELHLDSSMGLGVNDAAVASFPHGAPIPIDISRETSGRWVPDASTGQGGIGPSRRSVGETTSANDLAASRAVQERNDGVHSWLSKSANGDMIPPSAGDGHFDGVSDREIPLGDVTQNVAQPGRTYYVENGSGALTEADIAIMRRNRNWEDGPTILPISAQGDTPYQPESSAAAMRKFESMCRDNDSVVSRAATWGTRRRSLPSIVDMEGIVSGNFLKKLSISRGEPRRPSEFFRELRMLVRRPSASNLANLKRSLSNQEEDAGNATNTPTERRESRDSLAPPARVVSWGKRPTPSINTALVGMGSNIAAIGTTHARSGSISSTTPIMTPKSPFTLKVTNPITRRRAKSDLPRIGTESSVSNIADMWKKTGGPPVATLAKPPAVVVDQDDDEDDDEDLDDSEVSSEATKLIDEITPDFAGFQQHILKLNPMLAQENNYLVARIAHQQIIRYKGLLNAKIKHMGQVQNRSCQCGQMCIALGGSSIPLDSRGDSRSLDPLSARLPGSDDDASTPLEGAIAQESFPQDIPMPPTQSLPAEFECQLCFSAKKFQKPSDWTKHVHEDVQPFTCTWDRCREPKIFKRKADWVRHENEGHRHLEWWTCDVEDCRHTCYRRDNFLQHLVREHKFSEPKVKTKAAIKRAGALDPTWQKVERCHVETRDRPQSEPCRFCGKTFPTWKKLTVHLAKHMEQISLPILRLVSRKELDADTIISPVQEPPQRSFGPLPIKQEPSSQHFGQSPGGFQTQGPRTPQQHGPSAVQFQAQHGAFGYPVGSAGGAQFVTPQYHQSGHPHFDGLSNMPSIDTAAVVDMDMSHVNAFHTPHTYLNLPVTTGPFVAVQQPFMAVTNGMEPFPQLPISVPLGTVGMPAAGPSQMQYDHIIDPVSAGGAQFTPQGSASPYSRSPHQQPGQNFF